MSLPFKAQYCHLHQHKVTLKLYQNTMHLCVSHYPHNKFRLFP